MRSSRLWNRTQDIKFVVRDCFINTNGTQYLKNVSFVFCLQCGHCTKFDVPASTVDSPTTPLTCTREHEEFRLSEKVPGNGRGNRRQRIQVGWITGFVTRLINKFGVSRGSLSSH
ncbi:hypothetical protein DEO72_LG9g3107 [Vigna unguiculata]|uniref:Uncharacterized protein n=1 Tax=Vigna unguiculata TaxID=3917 RepID=A0A4D6N2S8_VIGUN|nr:hypothetical protein DEO72_LG9g3107 [Vigna unguiculata]